MLPSRGYFSGIPCVFFSDGGCKRAHCHYRHSYLDVIAAKKARARSKLTEPNFSDPGVNWSPDQVSQVTRLVEKAVDKALGDPTTTERPNRDDLIRNTLSKLIADPEALQMASKRTGHVPITQQPVQESIPAYRPTPISKLPTKHIPVVCVEKPYSTVTKTNRAQNSTGNPSDLRRSNGFFQTLKVPDSLVESSKSIEAIVNSQQKSKNNTTDAQDSHQLTNQKHRQLSLEKPEPSKQLVVPDLDEDASSKSQSNPQKVKEVKNSEMNLETSALNWKEQSCGSYEKDEKKSEDSHRHTGEAINLSKSNLSKHRLNSDAEERSAENPAPSAHPDRVDYSKPPTKKKKFEPVRASSTADPFSRWLKNKKIRQILGKDKKAELSPNLRKPEHPVSNTQWGIDSLPEPKIAKRTAHKQEFRPTPINGDVKIPSAFRHHFCAAFYEEFKKTMEPDEAKRRASEEELKIAQNSKTAKTYRNNCSLSIVKYRKGDVEANVKLEDFTSASCPDFTYGWSLYKSFSIYLLSGSELKENGYPLVVPNKKNCAFVDKSSWRYSAQQLEKPFHKICANCSVEFTIEESGYPTTKDDCFYHWGKLRKIQYKGQTVDKFTCCGGLVDSAPCEFSVYHVWSGRDEDCMEDFVETEKLPSYMEDDDAGIYALDCEMCYTTQGLELARLTVLDLNGRTVFDEGVSMKNPVLNYCTRFSGIDAVKVSSATYSFEDVRRWVLDHFYDKTILVGHSLENDLKALKLVHRTVVDTSVAFPHKFGPPHKMSLKHLANVVLALNIQENVDGHDSREDAATCLKLMMKKIREDSKVRKPRVIISYNGKKK